MNELLLTVGLILLQSVAFVVALLIVVAYLLWFDRKVWAAVQEMMDRALELGGAPYSKGRQWGPYLEKHMQDTGYWRLQKAIKDLLDPNYIMNPGVIGL